MIDIEFDYRKDSECGDPDTDSSKLYEIHQLLWSKNLISNKKINLEPINIGGKYGRKVLKNNVFSNLSSDRMCPHFDGKYKCSIDDWVTDLQKENFKIKVRTIGGHIVFPAHKKQGFTINQARGINKKICDRFDLTLECIARFYIQEKSPLFETLVRYEDFFSLFGDFKNYVDFFLLQDFVDSNYKVKYSLEFNNFESSPLPQTNIEYIQYMNNTIEVINKRNNRILEYLTQHCR